MSEHRSFCRICIASCGIVVTVEDGEVLAVAGDADHPVSLGYTCPKGRALPQIHTSPRRLDGALVRRDARLEPTTFDDAFADLGNRLRRVVDEHGTAAIGMFQGTGGYVDPAGGWVSRRLRRALDLEHTYSNATIDSVAKTLVPVLMGGSTGLVPHPDDRGRLLLLIGSNPVVSHGQSTGFANPIERIRDARSRGKVVVIDPRTTETARHADRHLAARPGTDHAVLAYVVRSLLPDVDTAALDARADHRPALAAAVAPFDRASAAALSGIAPDDLDELVAMVREAGRLAVVTGTGTTMSRGGNLVEWLAWSLMIITGSFDQPGGMWFNPGFLTRLDRRDRLPAAAAPAPGPPSRPEISRLAGEWPAAVIPDEIEAGRLRALIVLGGNLVTALPDTDRVREALAKLDVLVVLDVLTTETTEAATHVFACPDQLERPDVPSLDLFGNVFYSQYTPAVVEAPPSRPPMWRTLCRISSLLGVDILGGGIDPESVDTEEILQKVARQTDLQPLREADGPLIEAPALYGWAESRLPLGRWDLAPTALVEQLAAITGPPSLTLTPRRQLRRQNAVTYRDGERAEAHLHPVDAAAAGIADGDMIEITSSTGSLRLPVQVTPAAMPGTVSVPHGWAGTNVNQLTSRTDIDVLTGMPRLSGTAVTVAVVADRDQPVGAPA